MSLFALLETLLIGPLKLVFEVIFTVANRLIGHPGLAIILLSLAMNLLVLPLYRRADAMQEEARDTEARLHDGVAHIKKTFTGDERMMVLQTYYRQNHYKPTSALKGSVSLLLEIPFFMAAYQFLSHLDILDGVSFGPIADLGAPDGLLVIGGLSVNLLPILMTAINAVSSALYLKGFPLKTKVQLYAMALFFLVFLYTSPSCLVFYWTLNNLFSLCKTVAYKVARALRKRPKKTRPPRRPLWRECEPNKKVFWAAGAFLTVLMGVLIPTNFIAASPQEFVDINAFQHPLWYVASSFCLAAGFFLVWMGVFYWLAKPRGKVLFQRLMWTLCGVSVVNYMFFGTELGVISSTLQYESGLYIPLSAQWINIAVLAALIALLWIVILRWKRAAAAVLLVATLAMGGMSALNVAAVASSVAEISADPDSQSTSSPAFRLSTEGENVIVIMLDRAMGEYIPYLFREDPALSEQFAGFTYYDNTISFGGFTNMAAPALLGGYEYTPVELNRREDEALVDKHNEAVLMMPLLFAREGFEVTVCDPVYANYQWIPDLSLFDPYPEIDAYITKGKFTAEGSKQAFIENNHRNFFCFSLMKSMPLFLQYGLYDGGRYNQTVGSEEVWATQTVTGTATAEGLRKSFMESYSVLLHLDSMTRITEEDTDTFLFLSNDATHEPMLLQLPGYTPAAAVDNTDYDRDHAHRFTVDGTTLRVETGEQMAHYHVNMAVLKQLGNWFDWLREQGVFDNTRIILAADHGRHLGQLDGLNMGSDGLQDVELYYPLLMVKDFGSTEFSVCHDFMTNADVPTLAVDGLVDDPVNPFTGKPINSDEKTAHPQYVMMSWEFDVGTNNGNTFLPARWAAVSDSLWEEENWTFFSGKHVLDEHEAP